ncbi:MAG: hypothetical protein CL946_11315 [Ectothiorhodospiraceae bacterium]|nr:hypothetical protein [Ectothiorhodospiraceae bacterium]
MDAHLVNVKYRHAIYEAIEWCASLYAHAGDSACAPLFGWAPRLLGNDSLVVILGRLDSAAFAQYFAISHGSPEETSMTHTSISSVKDLGFPRHAEGGQIPGE